MALVLMMIASTRSLAVCSTSRNPVNAAQAHRVSADDTAVLADTLQNFFLGLVGMADEDMTELRTEYVGTRWYRAPEVVLTSMDCPKTVEEELQSIDEACEMC
eukprot:4834760-Amphidinium_carterae.1